MTKKYDVIIVGAGIVGQSLAIGLAKQSLTVALVDAADAPQAIRSDTTKETQVAYGARVSAISSASKALLTRLDVWQYIERMQPYTHMHVWDTDGFGDIAFDIDSLTATGESEEALGYIIENDIMNFALFQQISTQASIDCFFNTQLSELQTNDTHASARFEQAGKASFIAHSKLLVGADGANSNVRRSFDFAQTFWDYDHHAIVANVTTEIAHHKTARQAFTPFGPLAFLPLPDVHQSSIVFSQQSQQAQALMAMPEDEFEKSLQVAINNHYGKVSLNTKRFSFPLRMRYAKQWTCKHVAIMGDAAHTIHPLAGQGANLGLADVETMLDIIAQHKNQIGEVTMLRKYERCRKAEAIKVIATMEGFKRLFDGQNPFKKLLRNVGLLGADKFPAIKAFFIKQAMG